MLPTGNHEIHKPFPENEISLFPLLRELYIHVWKKNYSIYSLVDLIRFLSRFFCIHQGNNSRYLPDETWQNNFPFQTRFLFYPHKEFSFNKVCIRNTHVFVFLFPSTEISLCYYIVYFKLYMQQVAPRIYVY